MRSMATDRKTDAEYLWGDVLQLLEERGLTPAIVAMLKSCTPEDLDDEQLTISTGMSFARRKIEQEQQTIEQCIQEAAFQPLKLNVVLSRNPAAPAPAPAPVVVTSEELAQIEPDAPSVVAERQAAASAGRAAGSSANSTVGSLAAGGSSSLGRIASGADGPADDRTAHDDNILAEEIPESDSKLTFDRFVKGEENVLALEAAKQVANGVNKNYNPLFIYGRSGLGKTHLLRAIQNYIAANDPERFCIYRSGAQFVDDYVKAMKNNSGDVLTRSYDDVDVLIIDDIQNMRKAAGTISFFFNTFNTLMSRGKQIVLAADRSPSQLGMGADSNFDERDTSRMDSGITVSIQAPDYELKLNLVNAFYESMKADALAEHIQGMDGTISEDLRQMMAKKAGNSIRLIKSYVQSCLMTASQRERRGGELSRDDVVRIALQKWPNGQHIITIEQIQRTIESFYDISHEDLIGSKRNKELMEPRHVAIWLSRDKTDETLADIGKRFGNRSHATVKHSIAWVEDKKAASRTFGETLDRLISDLNDAD